MLERVLLDGAGQHIREPVLDGHLEAGRLEPRDVVAAVDADVVVLAEDPLALAWIGGRVLERARSAFVDRNLEQRPAVRSQDAMESASARRSSAMCSSTWLQTMTSNDASGWWMSVMSICSMAVFAS